MWAPLNWTPCCGTWEINALLLLNLVIARPGYWTALGVWLLWLGIVLSFVAANLASPRAISLFCQHSYFQLLAYLKHLTASIKDIWRIFLILCHCKCEHWINRFVMCSVCIVCVAEGGVSPLSLSQNSKARHMFSSWALSLWENGHFSMIFWVKYH